VRAGTLEKSCDGGSCSMNVLSTAIWPEKPSREFGPRWHDRIAAGAAMATLIVSAMVGGAAERIPEPANPAPAPEHATAFPGNESMIGAYLGAPYTYPSNVTVTKPGTHDFTAEDVGWDGKPFTNPVYYGVRIARWLTSGRTGAMLDFTHGKTIFRPDEEAAFKGIMDGAALPDRARLGDAFKRLEFSHGHNMLTFNGLLRLFSFHPRLNLYVGAGAGVSLPHTEINLKSDPHRTYEYQFAGPVGQALIGLEFRLPRATYFLEYKFTYASNTVPLTFRDGTWLFADLWRQFSRWWRSEPPPGGFVSTELASHQVIFGVGARFGGHTATPAL
jgi:lipid A oxidase